MWAKRPERLNPNDRYDFFLPRLRQGPKHFCT